MIHIPLISTILDALKRPIALAAMAERWASELQVLTGMTEKEAYVWLRYLGELQEVSPTDTTETLWPIFRQAVAESGSAFEAAAFVRDHMRRRGLKIPAHLVWRHGA